MSAVAKKRFENPLERKKLRGPRPSLQGKNNPMFGDHRNAGKNHPNWKGGVTPKNIKERNAPEIRQFIQETLKRDNYTCKICNHYGGNLEVDHIMPWSLYLKLRHDPSNVRTLCRPCHKKYGAMPHRKKWAISPVNHLHLRSV